MKDFLIIAPPVLVPTQIPVGALMFGASLQGHRIKTLLYDTSIDFFHFLLSNASKFLLDEHTSAHRRAIKAVDYFQQNRFYQPQQHRTHINNFHRFLTQWGTIFPDWQLGLTDVTFTRILPHNPGRFQKFLENGGKTPFSDFIQQQLIPAVQTYGIRNVGISLTYLSQIYFAVELALALSRHRIKLVLGGALANVLDLKTGYLFDFDGLFQRSTSLGIDLPHARQTALRWPELIHPLADYFTPVPVIPFPLSEGCYWNRCLFCPDYKQPFRPYQPERLQQFLKEALDQADTNDIIFNISDSAVPLAHLNKMLPFFEQTQTQFYGFFRFEKALADSNYLKELHTSGARLLQFGLESASPRILDLYQKGIDPEQAQTILKRVHITGMKNYVYLLFGLPTETDEDWQLTLEFMERNHEAIDFLNLALFNLPVDCEIARHPQRFKIELTEHDRYAMPLQLYVPFSNPNGAIRAQARQFLQQKFKRNKFIRPILLNTPDRVRIDHAIFFE